MSARYHEIMEQITVTDEMRARVLAGLSERAAQPERKLVRFPRRSRLAALAACAAVAVLCAVTVPQLLYCGSEEPVAAAPGFMAATEEEGDAAGLETMEEPVEDDAAAGSEAMAEIGEGEAAAVPGTTAEPGEDKTAAAPGIPAGAGEYGAASGSDIMAEPGENEAAAGSVPMEGPGEDLASVGSGGCAMIACADVEELSRKAGYPVADVDGVPFEITETIYTWCWGEIAQIDYEGAENRLTFRKAAAQAGVPAEELAGDYNVYDRSETVTLSDAAVTLEGNGDAASLAFWSDGGYAYSLDVTEGVSRGEMLAMAENVLRDNAPD